MFPEDYLAILDAARCHWCGHQGCAGDFMVGGVLVFACTDHHAEAKAAADGV